MKFIFTSTFALLATASFADESFSFYMGNQSVSDGVANVVDVDGSKYSINTSWDGYSLDNPVFYGFRYTNWAWGNFGWAIDFNHSKAYASFKTLAETGFKVMEFTDGINVLTTNAFYRFQNSSPLTPYVGAGIGISLPHVELQSPKMTEQVFEYQIGGLAATAIIGVSYKVTKEWSAFVEGKFDHSRINADMAGGSFKTNLNTQAINIGLSYDW